MGIDIVKLLRGAADMEKRFATKPPGDNPPLDFAGLLALLARWQEGNGFQIASTSSALDTLAQCLQEPRGLHDLLVQWIPAEVRHDRLSISLANGADRKKRKDVFLADLAAQQSQTMREARTAAGQFTVVVNLATIDEASVGQLIQLHALAAGINRCLTVDT
jgi:glucose-6-phosphate isomerase